MRTFSSLLYSFRACPCAVMRIFFTRKILFIDVIYRGKRYAFFFAAQDFKQPALNGLLKRNPNVVRRPRDDGHVALSLTLTRALSFGALLSRS